MANVGSRQIHQAVTESYVYSAFQTARTARLYLNPDHIDDYVSPDGGEHPEEYHKIQEEWQKLADRNSQGVLMIYLIQTANLWLCNHNDGMMFVTVFTGILNRRTGKFTYVNAGHNSPLISRREQSKFEYLPMAQNGFLGINDKAVFREETITLNHGDWLFLYTDGLTEAENGEHDFFGDDRLLVFI